VIVPKPWKPRLLGGKRDMDIFILGPVIYGQRPCSRFPKLATPMSKGGIIGKMVHDPFADQIGRRTGN